LVDKCHHFDDGAGPLALFFRTYLPLIMPPLLAIATYAFLYSWNEYLYAVQFLSGETHITIPVAMGNFLATDSPPWNLLMAESVLYSIPPVILYYCFRHHLLSGLVTGAVAGRNAGRAGEIPTRNARSVE